jgi:hypothetical protein
MYQTLKTFCEALYFLVQSYSLTSALSRLTLRQLSCDNDMLASSMSIRVRCRGVMCHICAKSSSGASPETPDLPCFWILWSVLHSSSPWFLGPVIPLLRLALTPSHFRLGPLIRVCSESPPNSAPDPS